MGIKITWNHQDSQNMKPQELLSSLKKSKYRELTQHPVLLFHWRHLQIHTSAQRLKKWAGLSTLTGLGRQKLIFRTHQDRGALKNTSDILLGSLKGLCPMSKTELLQKRTANGSDFLRLKIKSESAPTLMPFRFSATSCKCKRKFSRGKYHPEPQLLDI